MNRTEAPLSSPLANARESRGAFLQAVMILSIAVADLVPGLDGTNSDPRSSAAIAEELVRGNF